MRISIVVAIAAEGVIGANGGLAWRMPDDLRLFKRITYGKPVIMGRKTFDSIGKPLSGRENIILTRSQIPIAGAVTASSFEEALSLARCAAQRAGTDEICIIGGAEIYALGLPQADRIYRTEIDASVDGDAFFPEIDQFEWASAICGRIERSDRNQFPARILILDRTQQPEPLKHY